MRFLLAALLVTLPTPVSAAIIGVTGQGDILIPDGSNADLTPNYFDDDGTPHAWDELQNVTLSQDIIVDVATFGAYVTPFTSAGVTIAAGTAVSSHMVYQDPTTEGTRRTATYTFDADILGVILISDDGDRWPFDRLLATDFLRNAFTNSPGAGVNDRGVEFGPESLIFLEARSITLSLYSRSPGDQVRVITQAVPEPGTVLLLVVVALVALRERRTR